MSNVLILWTTPDEICGEVHQQIYTKLARDPCLVVSTGGLRCLIDVSQFVEGYDLRLQA